MLKEIINQNVRSLNYDMLVSLVEYCSTKISTN